MFGEEVGRWRCERCGRTIVAAGHRSEAFHGIGAFIGDCPWACGAVVRLGFRGVRPGAVCVRRSDEWDAANAPASAGPTEPI